MTVFMSDVAHDRADMRHGYPRNRTDRTASFALFTPLGDDDQPVVDQPAVQVAGRTRITTRWIGSKAADPDLANHAVVTVDDRTKSRELLSWMRWRIETWEHHGADPATGWTWTSTYAVAVDGALSTPYWVELEGVSVAVAAGYGESRSGVEAPAWITQQWTPPAPPAEAAAGHPSSDAPGSP
ncbi:hypothetical protein [Streptomyces sp. NPDC049879]|uniref:hypothetical protein n=1 Tax=Streptomyces sp. NPDC049879 TaxID=3365598 RepID=UPI0037B15102